MGKKPKKPKKPKKDKKMAINWSTRISKVNVQANRANVSLTRTDTVNVDDVFSINYSQAIIETNEQRLALLDAVWGEWQKEIAKRASIDAFITNLEQLANSNLEAREV